MIIGIDANEANHPVRVGVGQYAFNIIWELYKQDTDNEYHLYLKQAPSADLPPVRSNWQYHVFGPQKLWTIVALPFHLYFQKTKLNLFWSPSHYSPRFSPCPTVPTIHDLGYLDSPDQFNSKDIYQLTNWTKRSIFSAKHIVAVSEFTKNEINRIYGISRSKISVISNGVGDIPQISKDISTAVLKKFAIKNPYFLCLGTLKPNKNIPFLINSFSNFLKTQNTTVSEYQLIIAGKKGWQYDEIFELVKKLKLSEKIVFTDYITEIEKWTLYKNALCSVFPSTYEGFGIPAIESQKSKTPVIASNIAPYLEVLKNTALIINPSDQKSLTNAMVEVLSPRLRAKLIASGFKRASQYSWSSSAKKLIISFRTCK
jgi:glycosyltransferase involved in cell wall biosynthesis